MHKWLVLLRLFGVFPRHLRLSGRSGRLVIGKLSAPLLLHSIGFLTLKVAMAMSEFDLHSYLTTSDKFAHILSLFIWAFAWIFAEAVVIVTFVMKHGKFCQLVQILSKFKPLVAEITLTRNQKLVITLRCLSHAASFFVAVNIYSNYSPLDWFSVSNCYVSFAFLLLFQTLMFIITNNLSKIMEALVHEDGNTFCERNFVQFSSRDFKIKSLKSHPLETGIKVSTFKRSMEDNVKSSYKLKMFIDETVTLTSDIFGFPILVHLLYCLVGLTFTTFNLIESVELHSPAEIADYGSYVIEFVVTTWGFVDLATTINEEVCYHQPANFFDVHVSESGIGICNF